MPSEDSPDEQRRGGSPVEPTVVGLPIRPFLYTVDQIAYLLTMSEERLRRGGMIYYDGRSTGTAKTNQFKAHNIASDDQSPDWRVSEQELIRWMKYKGFKIYSRTWAKG